MLRKRPYIDDSEKIKTISGFLVQVRKIRTVFKNHKLIRKVNTLRGLFFQNLCDFFVTDDRNNCLSLIRIVRSRGINVPISFSEVYVTVKKTGLFLQLMAKSSKNMKNTPVSS